MAERIEAAALECHEACVTLAGLVPRQGIFAAILRKHFAAVERERDELRELLREVYKQAGNEAPANRRHALTPGLRDRIRDVIYSATPAQPEEESDHDTETSG